LRSRQGRLSGARPEQLADGSRQFGEQPFGFFPVGGFEAPVKPALN
jgi:hypothetical protein